MYRTALIGILLNFTVLNLIAILFDCVLYCIVWFCIAFHCIICFIVYSIVPHRNLYVGLSCLIAGWF